MSKFSFNLSLTLFFIDVILKEYFGGLFSTCPKTAADKVESS